MLKKVAVLDFYIISAYFCVWLVLDLVSINSEGVMKDLARLGFNVLLTYPLASVALLFFGPLSELKVLRRVILSVGNMFVMVMIGILLLMVCGSIVHFYLGGAK